MTRRRWIADEWTETTAALAGTQALHLARVLRATPGMQFDVLAGGSPWLAIITAASETRVEFRLLQQKEAAESLSLSVYLSVFKFDRFEWAIEKLTELGAARVHPVIANRTEKHLAQAADKRVERWRRIALEAAKQSRRSSILEIESPAPLASALSLHTDAHQKILLSESESQRSLLNVLDINRTQQQVVLAIGPEGGWTSDELSAFDRQDWTTASLGSTILRAETAAISAVAVCAAWLDHEKTGH